MGCTNSREINRKENLILKAEAVLGLQSLSTKSITSALEKHASNDSLTQIQLEKAMNSLGLSLSEEDSSVSMSSFLRVHKRLDQTYSLIHWQLLGILIGKSKANWKASHIFQLFKDENNTISLTKMKEVVLKEMIQISISLGYLVDIKSEEDDEDIEIEKYLKQLSSIKIIVVNKVAARMVLQSTNISHDVFVSVMTQYQGGALLTTTGWRTFIKNLYKVNKKNYSWAYPYSISNQ